MAHGPARSRALHSFGIPCHLPCDAALTPLKILHLETGRHLYGGARQVGYLIDRLGSDFGVQNVLVCQTGNPLARTLASAECIEMPVSGDADFSLQRRLQRLIREHRPDVVHVHSRRGADVHGGRAARAAGVPAVLTRRVQSAEPSLWLRWKLRPYAKIVAISQAVDRELLQAGINTRRLVRIPSAVDTMRFRPDTAARQRLLDRYGLKSDARIAGMAAQFIARKGHARLLPLVAEVSAALPDFRLLLFGQGPERERFGQQVTAAGLDRCIRFCGYEPDWPALVPGLELLLHPARREGLGNVVLEAMAAGVPVVAAAAGGIADAIEPDVDGMLLSGHDTGAWSRAVLELLSRPAERERLAAAARRTVELRFTIGAMATSYFSLYDDVRDIRR